MSTDAASDSMGGRREQLQDPGSCHSGTWCEVTNFRPAPVIIFSFIEPNHSESCNRKKNSKVANKNKWKKEIIYLNDVLNI